MSDFASVLSFSRQLDPTDALLASTRWGQSTRPTPIRLQVKSVRGTKSSRPRKSDLTNQAKFDDTLGDPNLQTVEYATIPPDSDTLVVSYHLRVLGNPGVPNACNKAEVSLRLKAMVTEYAATNGFETLGVRYAANIANARWLWRNLVGAEAVTVTVDKVTDGSSVKSWTFNASDIPLSSFSNLSEDVKTLGADIAQALQVSGHNLYQVTARARLHPGAEVYPSQLLTTAERADNQPSRQFFQVEGQAAMTSQKIGNAIRTIDTWHEQTDGDGNTIGPIAIEPFGAATTKALAYRKGPLNFYKLFDQWVEGGTTRPSDQHFVMATLIRGGVFGGKNE